MKDKDFDNAENFICHLIDVANAEVVKVKNARFRLSVAQIHAILLLARVIQERPYKTEA